jgi:heme a synthase
VRLPQLSPRAYRYLVAATLASLVFIMVTGAAVRLTDSGLGCSTWPSCEPDSLTPRSASDTHGMIEWVNRLITGGVGVFTLAAVVGARLRRPYRDDLFRWSLGLPAWVFANALVGALVVWLHLSPVSVIGHFVLSLAAVWNAVVLYERAAEEPAPGGERRVLATGSVVAACRLLLVAAGLVIVTGTLVTGSGPHAGDERADRLDLVVGDVVRIHGAAMVLFLGLTLAVLWMARNGDAAPAVADRLRQLLVVLVAQAGIGYWQYFTGVPALLVGFHVFGAALVWIAVLRVWFSLSAPAPATRPEAMAAAS